jgi:hypothetical protein
MRPIIFGVQTVAVVFLGIGLAGCAAGGWSGAIISMMSLAALILAGCTQSHGTRDDAGTQPSDSAIILDSSDLDAGGSWDTCCQDGVITTCFCPADYICNYGWFEHCPGGGCAEIESECPGGTDAGVDAGGDWEPCCQDGLVTTCFCPGGAECNYGWYNDCGDGTCVDPGSMCEPRDAGIDGGGTWEPCCVDGVITTCHCPPSHACNYGWYTDCGRGVCVAPGEECIP